MVNLAFLTNFLVTAYTCVMFGVSCIPFRANWDAIPTSKCFSKELLEITNQVNAGKTKCLQSDQDRALLLDPLSSCVLMRHRHGVGTPVSTAKIEKQLSVLFGLGLITAALSISHAAATTKKSLNEDETCSSS